MSRRRRWTPVKGTGNRVYEPGERLLIRTLDLPGRALFGLGRALGLLRTPTVDPDSIREVLVLRLDRIGDVLLSLPALGELRGALPNARIRLAVGSWSESVARAAPVDEIVVWNAPWVGRLSEGADSVGTLLRRARDLRPAKLDLAIDLQGDLRASLLMWLSGARIRAGYGNTGGTWLLTHVIPLDETVSWVEQNRLAVEAVLGPSVRRVTVDPLSAGDRDVARRLETELEFASRRPVVGIHPSGGRLVKQWDVTRWAAVADRLQREFGATVVVTGSMADRPLAGALAHALERPVLDTTGRLGASEMMALIERLDVFLSADTGPMHMACAVDTPSVAVFGPTDPVRFFSGGDGASGSRHVVVRPELWCSPCNLIRRPPRECAGPEMPECLSLVTVEHVYGEAARLLTQSGFVPAAGVSG